MCTRPGIILDKDPGTPGIEAATNGVDAPWMRTCQALDFCEIGRIFGGAGARLKRRG